MAKAIFEVDRLSFDARAFQWAQQFGQLCYLQSNGYVDEYSSIDCILAVDAQEEFYATSHKTFEHIENFRAKYSQQWVFGFFGYDLKNELEGLHTSFPNPLKFPDAYFFVPKTIIKFFKSSIEIDGDNPHHIFECIQAQSLTEKNQELEKTPINIRQRMSKEAYFGTFSKMMYHIKRGDIYEVNLCQEFYAEHAKIDPASTYRQLNRISPTPFSTFFKLGDKFILSASPERFLAKRGKKLISQPIKGTAPRGKDKVDDDRIKHQLRNDPKEIAENVMIVDLVRNDMTQASEPGTVTASKKLEVHTFKQVHQLISTITGIKKTNLSDISVIKNLFPPGSMTGAPKISAMQLCDKYETSKRGVYSGAIGYFCPDGDFDFNVVIRTILYNQTEQYLSFHTGGALTYNAIVEDEYNECLLKASAINTALKKLS
ncbi:anthranilate synthase component I family protein [Sphingobacterium paucimobilis]|uniref:Aminodeoxychorismate synthase n=1 Tax=Sphingobacterium paucimobilis HER1398 TaxID=1346330 RepID=U2HX11_9SPHI|nr:anthranilate synthase component I family protein [Sphingobacterium paucimobilis]ERJ59815.1 hypothetical protein M472_13665 [Sphingobacterium paucimobilis HER1398]